jgi:hypothetical protein
VWFDADMSQQGKGNGVSLAQLLRSQVIQREL